MVLNKSNNFFTKSTDINRNVTSPTIFYSTKKREVYKTEGVENKTDDNKYTEDYSLSTTLSERDIDETMAITIEMPRDQISPQFNIALSAESLYEPKFRYNFINRFRLLLEYAKNSIYDSTIQKDKPIILEIFSFIESAIQDPKNINKEIIYKLEDEIAYELLKCLRDIVNKFDNKKNDFLNEIEYVSKIIIEIIAVNPSLALKLKSKDLFKKIFSIIKSISCDVDIWKLSNILNRENCFLNEKNILSGSIFLFPIIKILSPSSQSLNLFLDEICKTTHKKVDFLIDKNTKLEEFKVSIDRFREKIDANGIEISDLVEEFYYIEKNIYELSQRYENLEKASTSSEKKIIFSKIKMFLFHSALKYYIEPSIVHSIIKLHYKNIQLSDVINKNIEDFNKLKLTQELINYYNFEYPSLSALPDKETKMRHSFIYNSILLCKKKFLATSHKNLNIINTQQKKNINIEIDNIFNSFQKIVAEKKKSRTFLFVYLLKKSVDETIKCIESDKYDATQLKAILYAQLSMNIKKFMCFIAQYSINSDSVFNTRFQDLLEVYEIYNHEFIDLYSHE